MKRKFFAAMLVAAFLLTGCSSQERYPDCGLVTNVTEVGGVYEVEILMQNGNQFAFATEDCDWCLNDIAAVVFNSQGTPEIYDDVIVDVKYSGYVTNPEAWVKTHA